MPWAPGAVSFPTASSIRVQVTRPVTTVFARVLGITQYAVPAAATAGVQAATETGGLRPWGIPAQDFQGYQTNVTYKLKLTAKSAEYTGGGNFHALDLDGSGANVYGDTIVNGSSTRFKVGQTVPTETGNMTGPTRSSLDTLVGSDTDSSYANVVARGESDCPRVVTVVIIRQSSFGKGKTDLVVDGFASFFITDYKNGEVTGQFIRYVDMNATSDGSPVGAGTQAIALIN